MTNQGAAAAGNAVLSNEIEFVRPTGAKRQPRSLVRELARKFGADAVGSSRNDDGVVGERRRHPGGSVATAATHWISTPNP